MTLILTAAILLLRLKFEGESLGSSVTELLNAKMRGRIEIQTIEWPKSSIPTLATGGWVPVTMKGVKVWDAGTPRKQILDLPLVTGEADVHALLFKGQFIFRHVVATGGWVILEQVDEALPLQAYDKTVYSLLQAFESPHRAGFATGVFVAGASIFDVRDFELDHVKVDLRTGNYVSEADPGHPTPAFTFTAKLEDVSTRGSLYMDGSDPLVPKLYFSLTERDKQPGLSAGKGSLVNIFDVGGVPGYTIPLDGLEFKRIAQLPEGWTGNVNVANSLVVDGTATTTHGAVATISGGIDNYFDRPYDGQWAMKIDVANLGPTLHEDFTKIVGGDDVRATFKLRGPYIALPKIFFTITGLDLDLPIGAKGDEPLRLAIDHMEGQIDEVNDQIKIDQTVARGADGEVQLAGTVQLAPVRLDGNIFITKPLDLARWLPKTVRDVIGTRLSGSIHMAGDASAQLRFDDFTNVALGSAHFDRRGVIVADHYFDRVFFSKLGITAGNTYVQIDPGSINTVEDTLDLTLVADSKDLDYWLHRLGEPAYAKRGGGTLHIRDSWLNPRVSGHVYAGGVPMIDDVNADIALADQNLAINAMQSKGLGGNLSGAGHLTLAGTPVVRDFHLSGRELDAAKIPGTGAAASGKIQTAEIDVSGPISRLAIAGAASADELDVAGDRYQHVAMCINGGRKQTAQVCRAATPRVPEAMTPDEKQQRADVAIACSGAEAQGALCVTARADRAQGGTVDITAILGHAGGKLAGAVDLVGVPLAAFLGPDAVAGGDLDTHLFLGGTTTAPVADGAIELARGWVEGAFLGDASIQVKPAGPGRVALSGTALQGRVQIHATVGTTAPFPATITADLRRVDLDPFYDLKDVLHVGDPVHAWATGRIEVSTILGAAHPPTDATIALSELSLTVDQRDADGRPAPLTMNAASPVRLRYHDGAVDLVCVDPQPGAAPHITPCPIELATPAGLITISGSARPDKLAIDASGRLDGALLRPLMAGYVEESGGSADLELHVQGTIAKPLVNATLSMNDIWFRPLKQDTVIHLPEGTIGLKDNNDLGFTGMKLTVMDNDTGDLSELDLGGGVKLED
ncbi:MAG TPA: hypothetical protein VL463_08985, partial [Kofleriaceae bacterium]|nr:hypothetical protein [Kofleriaceae bacterium]